MGSRIALKSSVYARRRRVSLALILLLSLGLAACKKKIDPGKEPIAWIPLTRGQARAKLEAISRSVKTLQTTISISGTTPSLTEKNIIHYTPVSLGGSLYMTESHQLSLSAGVLLNRIFEMVTNGTNYEVYNNGADEIYVNGLEEGPPSKPIPSLGALANQFVGMKPRRIHEALMLNVDRLLQNPSINFVTAGEVVERKHYLIAHFIDSAEPERRLLQRVWFDLTTPSADIVRRQTYTDTGDVDTDVQYSKHESVNDTLRYPSRIDMLLHDTGTELTITLNPKDAQFNVDIDPERFTFPTEEHRKSRRLPFEPLEPGVVNQPR